MARACRPERVWERSSQSPITNATIHLSPSGLADITRGQKGIYAYPAIPDGTYTVTASAPGFESNSVGVYVRSGQLESVVIPLAATGGEGEGEGASEGEGEGEGEGQKNSGCSCGPDEAGPLFAPGDVALAALLIGALFYFGRAYRREY